MAKRQGTIPFGHVLSPKAANNNNNNNNNFNRGFRFFGIIWFQWASSTKDSSKNKIVLKALNASSTLYPLARILKIFGAIILVRRPSFKLAPEYKVRLTDSRYLLFRQWCSETLLPRPLNGWFVIAPLTSCRWILRRDSLYRSCHPRKPLCTRGFVVFSSSSDLMTPLFSYGLLRSSFTNSFNFPYDRVQHNFFKYPPRTRSCFVVSRQTRSIVKSISLLHLYFRYYLLCLSRVVYTTADTTCELFCASLHTLIWTTN